MNNFHVWVVTIIASLALGLGVATLALIGGNQSGSPVQDEEQVGGGSRFPNGISANSTAPSVGEVLTTTLQVGSTGSDNAKFIQGTCNLIQSIIGSHSASTTKQFHCTVTGATSGDKVFVSLPLGAGSTGLGFVVQSAYATTTDLIGVSIANLTGSATSSYSQATTSVAYWIAD